MNQQPASRNEKGFSLATTLAIGTVSMMWVGAMAATVLPAYNRVAITKNKNIARTSAETALDIVLADMNKNFDGTSTSSVYDQPQLNAYRESTVQVTTADGAVPVTVRVYNRFPEGATSQNFSTIFDSTLNSQAEKSRYYRIIEATARMGRYQKVVRAAIEPMFIIDDNGGNTGANGASAGDIIFPFAGFGDAGMTIVGRSTVDSYEPGVAANNAKDKLHANVGSNVNTGHVGMDEYNYMSVGGNQFEFPNPVSSQTAQLANIGSQFNAQTVTKARWGQYYGSVYSNGSNTAHWPAQARDFFPSNSSLNSAASASGSAQSSGTENASNYNNHAYREGTITVDQALNTSVTGTRSDGGPAKHFDSGSHNYIGSNNGADFSNPNDNTMGLNNTYPSDYPEANKRGRWMPTPEYVPPLTGANANANLRHAMGIPDTYFPTGGNAGNGGLSTTAPAPPAPALGAKAVEAYMDYKKVVMTPAPTAPGTAKNLGAVNLTSNATVIFREGATPPSNFNIGSRSSGTLVLPSGDYKAPSVSIAGTAKIVVEPGAKVNLFLEGSSSSTVLSVGKNATLNNGTNANAQNLKIFTKDAKDLVVNGNSRALMYAPNARIFIGSGANSSGSASSFNVPGFNGGNFGGATNLDYWGSVVGRETYFLANPQDSASRVRFHFDRSLIPPNYNYRVRPGGGEPPSFQNNATAAGAKSFDGWRAISYQEDPPPLN
ncbi:MAG: hypothetical protein K2W95_03970 [Candidatus Obscuribacterales bacterium]|nr:hypothetical protein [Candidatus Obscuribacterales bacterium]